MTTEDIDRRSPLLRTAGSTVLIATVAGLAILGIAAAAGVDFRVRPPGSDAVMDINAVAVAVTIILTTALGWAVVALARRVGRPSLRAIGVIAAVFAVISVTMPLGAEGDAAARLVLASLHLVTGAIFVAGVELLRRRMPSGDHA